MVRVVAGIRIGLRWRCRRACAVFGDARVVPEVASDFSLAFVTLMATSCDVVFTRRRR